MAPPGRSERPVENKELTRISFHFQINMDYNVQSRAPSLPFYCYIFPLNSSQHDLDHHAFHLGPLYGHLIRAKTSLPLSLDIRECATI